MPLNVAILGLGAVGGALGLALGTIDPKALEIGRPVITGWDSDKRMIRDARGRLAIDKAENDLEEAVSDADIVFVATPYNELREVLRRIGPALKNGSVVTDTAPTKKEVLGWATEFLPRTVDFVGGHPMAGIGGPSLRDITKDSLRGAIYCLVPLSHTRRQAVDGLEALVSAIGAKPYYIDADEHDSYVAAGGHLPLAVAVAVMETVSRSGGWREIQPVAGQALLGITELVDNDPATSTEMLLSNRDALAGWLERVSATLAELQIALRDPAVLQDILDHARDARASWEQSEPNTRPGEDAFYGTVENVQTFGPSSLFFGRRPNRDKRR